MQRLGQTRLARHGAHGRWFCLAPPRLQVAHARRREGGAFAGLALAPWAANACVSRHPCAPILARLARATYWSSWRREDSLRTRACHYAGSQTLPPVTYIQPPPQPLRLSWLPVASVISFGLPPFLFTTTSLAFSPFRRQPGLPLALTRLAPHSPWELYQRLVVAATAV